MANEQKEISDGTWWIALGVALFIDVLELILVLLPVVGEILAELIDWSAFAGFWLWLKTKGVEYNGKKRTMIIGAIIGVIPVVNNILPELTWTIWQIRKGYKKQQRALAQQKQNEVIAMQKQQTSNFRKAA